VFELISEFRLGMVWGSGRNLNLLWYQNWCKSQGKEGTPGTQGNKQTPTAKEARPCLMARGHRAKLLPMHA